MLPTANVSEIENEAELLKGRFALYEAENGHPSKLIGRFGNFSDIMRRCEEGPRDHKLVEVARYAYLPVAEFQDLFGPLRRRAF